MLCMMEQAKQRHLAVAISNIDWRTRAAAPWQVKVPGAPSHRSPRRRAAVPVSLRTKSPPSVWNVWTYIAQPVVRLAVAFDKAAQFAGPLSSCIASHAAARTGIEQALAQTELSCGRRNALLRLDYAQFPYSDAEARRPTSKAAILAALCCHILGEDAAKTSSKSVGEPACVQFNRCASDALSQVEAFCSCLSTPRIVGPQAVSICVSGTALSKGCLAASIYGTCPNSRNDCAPRRGAFALLRNTA